MLADPQAVTISGTASSLPRLDERPETHVYSDLTNSVDLFVTQRVAKDGRRRANYTLQKSVIVTDPITGLKSKLPYSVTFGFSYPVGITSADVEALYTGGSNALEASTNALLKKVIGGEK
jgi:hypothetical protein